MMAARKSGSAFQLLSRGPLAAPTLLQGAAFFIGQGLLNPNAASRLIWADWRPQTVAL